MAALELVRPGLLTTVQDLGRVGLGRLGVARAGAMDPVALRAANRAVGNEPGAAALEITGPGVEVRFLGAAVFAIGGGDLGATLDGAEIALWQPHAARDGASLAFTARRRGARAILALGGGLAVQRVLGSAATDLDAGFGRRLARGDRLSLGTASAIAPAPPPPLALYEDPFVLRFVAADDVSIPAETAAIFAASAFRVTDRSSRAGYRLAGPVLAVAAALDRISEPIPPGTIQLPPDGQPILLMADGQSTGGYARLGYLAAADRPKAAQLWPGDEVRFVAISRDEAERAAQILL
jgi:biotin-dependent carboxylase-like uncharacterized protein